VRRTQSWFILFFVFNFLSQFSVSQDIGRYPVVNFHHREYSGHSQSWSIVQDKRGLIILPIMLELLNMMVANGATFQ